MKDWKQKNQDEEMKNLGINFDEEGAIVRNVTYGHCPHGENMVTCHECNDKPMKITMELPYVYFLEEPNKGWISKQWMLATIESFGKSNLSPFTWNPLEAVACFSYSTATDVHTLLRHYQWYSNDTLKITEHEFISTLP